MQPRWINMNLYLSKVKQVTLTFSILLIAMNLSAQDWIGNWEGTLIAGPQKMKIVFHITKDSDGKLGATMDSPDQLAYDIKMDDAVVKNGEITLSLQVSHAEYIGKMNEDKKGITGNWIQGVPLELNLTKTEVDLYKRPQEPKGPFPYKIEEVSYENKKANSIKLAGTLTIPDGEEKHPVVILISGSGPQDRDGSMLKHKYFWVLADYLTRNGFAVLRFDDRGFAKSEGTFVGATSADFATDVAAGVKFLKGHSNIDAENIGLMGHSEGGMIAPIVARKDKNIAFMILLAGPGVPGSELLLQQSDDLMKEKGIDENIRKSLQSINSKLYETIIKDKKNKTDIDDLMEAVKEEFDAISEEDKKTMKITRSAFRQSLKALESPWMRYLIRSVPDDYLKKVKCPVLALNGDKDLQIAGKVNLDGIKASLTKAKNTKSKCVLLPNLNHLFQTCETGAIEEYVNIEETFSPDAMKLILEWLNELGIKS
jgi:pimeloyl-ACP methyl ester carboxylesterase